MTRAVVIEEFGGPEVLNSSAGSYADHNVVAADIVALEPRNLDHTEAVRPGENVLDLT